MVSTNKSDTNNRPPRGAQRPEIAAILNAANVGRGNALLTGLIAAGTIAVVVMYIVVFALADNGSTDRSVFTAPITAEPAAITPAETVPAEIPTAAIATVAIAGPVLAITDPADNARLSVRNIVLSGQSDPGATVTVSAAGADFPAQIDASGAWTFDAQLDSGENLLLITAADADGNITQNTIHLFYDPPAPAPAPAPASEPAAATNTASTYWHTDIANGVTPSTHIIGTTSPGALVSVTSPYGFATTASDAGGAWTVNLTFTDAPIGEEFLVTVAVSPTDGPATTQQFPFTYLGMN